MLIEHRLKVKNDHEHGKGKRKGNEASIYTENYRRPLMQTRRRN